MTTMTEPTRTTTPPRDPAAAEKPPVMLPDGRPNVSLLEDQLPPWLKASRTLAIFTAVLGLVFFSMNRLDVRHTDVWGHLSYGRWILAHGELPQTEPLLPLSRGVPWVDVAWLSKVAGVWVFDRFGIAGLQMIHAATLTFALSVLAWLFYRKTRSLGWTLLGLLMFGVVDYQQLLIHRPQDIGVACFVLSFAWALSGRDHRAAWVGLPLVFGLWANFHGSFPMGLLVLGAVATGRAIDVLRRTRSPRLMVRSRHVWRAVLMLELCAAAVLLNPSGIKVYSDVLTIAANENLPVLYDWSALTLRMGQGQIFVASLLALAVLYRLSPRRVSAVEVLLLLGFAIASLWSLRMIIWYGPAAGYCLAVHGAATWRRYRHLPLLPAPIERRGIWTVTTVGLAWIFFAYTPFGMQRIHGRPTGEAAEADFRNSVVARTPLDVVDYLHSHADELPAGLMYNSQEWGDFLQWAAPPKFPVFVNSHVHLTPEEVWTDYLQIHSGGGDWSDKLNRYGANSVLVDTTNYMGLIRALRDHDDWREVFSDPQGLAVLFVRNRPI